MAKKMEWQKVFSYQERKTLAGEKEMSLISFKATREDGATYKGLASPNFRKIPTVGAYVIMLDKIRVWADGQKYELNWKLLDEPA